MPDIAVDPAVRSFLVAAIARATKQSESEISPQVDLIDLGLKSIDAVVLSGEVEDEFKIELDPATVFEHETLESFAAEITRRQKSS